MKTDIIVLLLLSCLTAFFWQKLIKREVLLDFKDIQEDGSKNSLGKAWHAKSAIKGCIWAAVHAVMFAYFNWGSAVSMFFLLLAIFWLVFDRLLNLKRDKAAEYVGYTSGIDKFFRDMWPDQPERAMQKVKVILLMWSAACFAANMVVYFI